METLTRPREQPQNTAPFAPHTQSPQQAVDSLQSNLDTGIEAADAASRRERFGPNQLREGRGRGVWSIAREQVAATLTIVLIVAAVISFVLGDHEDAIAILAIVLLNTALGVRQEYKAERAMAALKRLAAPIVRVRRDAAVAELPATDLVPGDIVLLEPGAVVPADMRLLETIGLRIEEAALTGESAPVDKQADFLATPETALADRRNMAYLGSTIAAGRGLGLVTGTGMQTELGAIANMLEGVQDDSGPLQERLDQLGRVLAVAALAIVAVIFGLGVWRGEDPRLMFLTAVSLAVAAVPEGLPAVVTIALSLGAQRMLQRNALIRRLPAVATLGSVSVICSDKTGTLTQNRMTATVAFLNGQETSLDSTAPSPDLADLLRAAALCNDAILDNGHAVGDPTETALVLAALQAGLDKNRLEETSPRIDELAFESDRKRMTTIHQSADGRWISYTKGAADRLLALSSAVRINNQDQPLTPDLHASLDQAHENLASRGVRVLGVARRTWTARPAADETENGLTFLGLIGMIDPPRPEARQAIEECTAAGIRVVMITGDHPLTARSIARQTGISQDPELLSGAQLDTLSEEQLEESAERVDVFARVSPEHKLRLVDALKRRNKIVAMTGDGVNDAPALKQADIGVAMGVTGTDVSKEASDMVLRDDNFATIVAAVEEGRVIFDNIRKFIRYLLSANVGELSVMLAGPALGMPLPLLPLQILWMNLITDGPPALALGIEKAEEDVMRRPPRRSQESVFSDGVATDIAWIGPFAAALALLVGYNAWAAGNTHWQTMIFVTLTFSQLALAPAVRLERRPVFGRELFGNPALVGAVALSATLQLLVVYWAPMQPIFGTQALTLQELLLSIAAGSGVFFAVELVKAFRRRFSSTAAANYS